MIEADYCAAGPWNSNMDEATLRSGEEKNDRQDDKEHGR